MSKHKLVSTIEVKCAESVWKDEPTSAIIQSFDDRKTKILCSMYKRFDVYPNWCFKYGKKCSYK